MKSESLLLSALKADRGGQVLLGLLAIAAVAVPVFNLLVPEDRDRKSVV